LGFFICRRRFGSGKQGSREKLHKQQTTEFNQFTFILSLSFGNQNVFELSSSSSSSSSFVKDESLSIEIYADGITYSLRFERQIWWGNAFGFIMSGKIFAMKIMEIHACEKKSFPLLCITAL